MEFFFFTLMSFFTFNAELPADELNSPSEQTEIKLRRTDSGSGSYEGTAKSRSGSGSYA
ncbi:hypothetical protein [Gilvibacter sp.]|uniref:hypothetical protein n=1 Tax=Gilvibacter sp. TaxID=2729997 RepID=UPI0025C5E526|nr:hypothetical protein [Gilvibacter sp.]NQX77575.1 hypothetical protein [Gilvibacter sp.]